jgi:peptidoglycan/xylan/chitin deacetylase (PgdA/CDA1 family)
VAPRTRSPEVKAAARSALFGRRNPPIVLMYHGLADATEAPSRYVLPSRRFAQQMAWLRGRRYTLLSLADLQRALEASRPLPTRAVVVTFDDAYADLVALGLPTLQRFRVPATAFVVSRRAGRWNDWEPVGPLAGRPMASWTKLRDLQDAGVSIGAHSRTHRSLPSLSLEAARDEIGGSGDDIRDSLGTAPAHFAYPHGHTSTETMLAAREAGYALACGVSPRPCTPDAELFDLPRIEMQGTWRLLHLALALWLGRVPGRLAN